MADQENQAEQEESKEENNSLYEESGEEGSQHNVESDAELEYQKM